MQPEFVFAAPLTQLQRRMFDSVRVQRWPLVPDSGLSSTALGGAVITPTASPHVRVAMSPPLDVVDEAVQNDEFGLELDPVDARLEGALDVEQIGALYSQQANVERDDEDIGPDELAQQALLLVALGVLGASGWDGP